MSLLVITAKDGAQYQLDPRTLANLKDLRAWVEDHAKIAAANQILLSGRGTQLREATLAQEAEVFVFDRQILDHNTKPLLLPIPPLVNHPSPPTEFQTQKDHAAWITAFKQHLQWAESVLTKGKSLAAAISSAEAQMKNIQRSVVVAADNLDNHVVTFRKKLRDRQDDAGNLLRNQEEVFNNWENSIRISAQVTLHPGFLGIAQRQANNSRVSATLADLLNIGELKKAHAASEIKAQEFIKNMANVQAEVEEIAKRNASLRDDIQRTSVGSSGNYQSDEPQNILEDMEAMTKRLHGDQLRVQDAHSLAQVAKWAHSHTKDVLPGLGILLTEMSRLHQQAISQKNNVILAAHKNMIGVVQVQSSLGFLSPLFEKAQLPESESFLLLARAYRLPNVYGALLIECVRRREWSEKLMTESRRLAEELASLKSEEEKRRKKWQKQVGNMLPFTVGESRVLSLEVNLEGNDDRWPQVTRQDIEAFLEQCKQIPQMESTLKEVTQLYQDMDKPRKSTRRVKGFKAGSVHEAAMGASSFLVEDARELQEKIAFLENQDLNQKSRIRRLEDLLHRAYGRAGSGFSPSSPIPGQYPNMGPGVLSSSPSMNGMNGFPPQGPQSVASRRLSANMEQSERERSMAARVLSLETELHLEKERTMQLQKEADERVALEQQINDRMLEADHTKIDLLANLEAQQQEFVLERKELQRGLAELRQELDEAYEELHRVEEMKSTEAEKNSALEARIGKLEDELVTAIQEQDEWQRKYSEEVEKLKRERDEGTEHIRKDYEEERALNVQLEASLKDLKEDNSKYISSIENLEGTLKQTQDNLETAKKQHDTVLQNQATSLIKLQQAHRALAPNDSVPKELRLLADTIEALANKTMSHQGETRREYDELEAKYNKLKASIDLLQSRFDSRTIRARDLTQRLFTHNTRSIQLLEQLGFSVIRRDDTMQIVRISRSNSGSGTESMMLSKSMSTAGACGITTEGTNSNSTPKKISASTSAFDDINLLYWMEANDSDAESEKYAQYLSSIGMFDLDAFSDAIVKRVKEAEHMARRWQKEAKAYREKSHRYHAEAHEKIAFKSFKEGDLALFLPTRNQANRPWAAFNVGAPHFFLKEQESHKLRTRDWLLARISKVEERVVDLGRSTSSLHANPSVASDTASLEDENPFELSDGLRWFLLEAYEEKPGAPATPGLSSSTVSTSKLDAKGSLKSRKLVTGCAKKTLSHLQEEGHKRRGSNSSIGRSSIFNLVTAGGSSRDGLITANGEPESAVATAGGSRASTPALVSHPHPVETLSQSVTPTSSGSMSKAKGPDGASGPVGTEEKFAELQSVIPSRML